jgi:hypothetical protein
METQTIEGKEVTLRSAHGNISRVAVKLLEDGVLVCRREEFDRAKKEGRPPVVVRFRRADILAGRA